METIGDVIGCARKNAFIVAEVAQAHDGSLGTAHAYIDAVCEAGAHAIKFQTHIAEEESSHLEPWRVKFSYQDETRYDYWKRMEFTKPQWIELKNHANCRGLVFISSPFSIKAVELLDSIGMGVWKVASGEVNSMFLLDAMIKTGKPIILSSGMSFTYELDERIRYLSRNKVSFAVLECTSQYPVLPEKLAIKQIPYYKEQYDCPVGISDHSGTIFPSLAAVTLGADIVEVHVTFSKNMFGPDVSSSITLEQLRELVEGSEFIKRMMQADVKKDETTKNIEKLRMIFGKGIMLRRDILAGHVIEMDDLVFVKPQAGISAQNYKDVIGRKIKIDLNARTFLTQEMLEDE